MYKLPYLLVVKGLKMYKVVDWIINDSIQSVCNRIKINEINKNKESEMI